MNGKVFLVAGYMCGNKNRRSTQLGDSYGWDFQYYIGSCGDLNLDPGIWLDEGSEGKIVLEKLGYTITRSGGWVKAEDMLDAYYQEMQGAIDWIKKKVNKELAQNEMEALLDVYYAGSGWMTNLIDDVNNGTVTQESFTRTITEVPANLRGSYSSNPWQKLPRMFKRREGDYKLYTEGLYCSGDNPNKHYEFSSETPFQDMINDVNSGKLVD